MKDLNKQYEKEAEKAIKKILKYNKVFYDFYDINFKEKEISLKFSELKKVIKYFKKNVFLDLVDGIIYDSSISKSYKEFLSYLENSIYSANDLYDEMEYDRLELYLDEKLINGIENLVSDEEKLLLKLEKHESCIEALKDLFNFSERSFGIISTDGFDFQSFIILKFKDYILIINIKTNISSYAKCSFNIKSKVIIPTN